MTGFRVSIVTPRSSLEIDGVEFIDVPAADGRMTILPGHQATIAALSRGMLSLRPQGQPEARHWIGPGIMTVSRTGVAITTRDVSEDRIRQVS